MNFSDLERFILCFNDFNSAIKFTWNISAVSLECLDVLMSSLMMASTCLYTTNLRILIHYSSHHPKASKNSISYSQFLRLRRICSSDDDFMVKSDEIVEFFEKRGYLLEIIEQAKQKVLAILHSEALKDKLKGLLILHRKSLWFCLSAIVPLRYRKNCA